MAQAGPVSSNSGRLPALPKYEILEELGHGGMATVYRAHDSRLGRDVAIKVLHPHLRDNREIAHRFASEAKAVAKLRHANIVEVFDVSEAGDGERYLVVELVRGITLRKILEERGALPPEVAAEIAIEILAALSHAHAEGVIHRDVKPENVLMEHPHLRPQREGADSLIPRSNPNDTLRIKLTDFGIAKMLDAQGVTSTGQVLGSPAHMSPEQIDGGEVDQRADIFGVGVLLYECMVGHLPFEGTNPAQVLRRVLDGQYNAAERDRPVVGKTWSDLLDRALNLDQNARFPNADDMRETMIAYLKTLGIEDSRADMEKYFRDPAAYETAHAAALVAKLSELGAEAKKRGDVQGAANAYNRALAYAPNDSQLLRVAASLARAEERKQFLKKTGAPFVLFALLGLTAFSVTRFFTPATPQHDPVARPIEALSATPTESASVRTAPLVTVSPKMTATTTRVLAAPQLSASAKKEPKTRVVMIGSVRPIAGVRAQIDSGSIGEDEIAAGHQFPRLDEGAHDFVFSCINDMCLPQRIPISASDHDETINVALTIRPAILIVDGPPSGSYGIEQYPSIVLRPGVAAQVPMSRGKDSITVIERQSGKKVSVDVIPGAESKHPDFTQLAP